MTQAVLSAQMVNVRLRGRAVLNGVSLDVQAGQWTAIVGPNGAGKSTLLRALAGLLPSDAVLSGEVRALGRTRAQWAPRDWARHCSWFSSAEVASGDMSVRDAVAVARIAHSGWLGAVDHADAAAIERAMERCELTLLAHRRLGELSSGERQRALLARALAVEAQCVLMDEPLAHLDAPHQAQWIDTARHLAREGRAVVSVLHELQVALCADWLVLVDQGCVVHQGAVHSAPSHRALEALFGARIAVHRVDTVAGPAWAVLSR